MPHQGYPVRLLILDESSNEAEYLLNILRKGGYATRPKLVHDTSELLDAIVEKGWDLVLTEPELDERTSALDVLEAVSSTERDIPVVVVTETDDQDQTVQFMRAGARDVVNKADNRHLLCVIERELISLEDRRTRRRAESAVRDMQRRNESLLETSNDAVAYMLDGMHVHVNPRYLELFGFTEPDELDGLPMMDLVIANDQLRMKEFIRDLNKEKDFVNRVIEFTGQRNDEREFPVRMKFSSSAYDGEECCQVIARDLSESEELKRLSLITQQDSLTALYSHRYFLDALENAVSAAVEDDQRSFLIYIELDKFNVVKDSVGIPSSDKVIRETARIIHNQTGPDDVLARFGDITFTMLLSGNDLNVAMETGDRIRQAVDTHICEVDGHSVAITCSVGICPITEMSSDGHTILARAAEACAEASRDYGNKVVAYKTKTRINNEQFDLELLTRQIQESLADPSRLCLVYQPLVNLDGARNEAYSVFLRVRDPAGKVIPTAAVFRVAEENKLARQLDEWVVNEAMIKLAEQQQQGRNTRIFIKLSEQAIRDESMILTVGKLLKNLNLPPEKVAFQISETSAVSQVKLAKAFVQGMKQMRCPTVLEHFGSGIDSFKLLNHADVDILKVDGSYTPGLAGNQDNQMLLRNIIDTARQMGKQVIVPWVEDANSLAVIWQLGANYAQGNYIHEPFEEMSYDFSETML